MVRFRHGSEWRAVRVGGVLLVLLFIWAALSPTMIQTRQTCANTQAGGLVGCVLVFICPSEYHHFTLFNSKCYGCHFHIIGLSIQLYTVYALKIFGLWISTIFMLLNRRLEYGCHYIIYCTPHR